MTYEQSYEIVYHRDQGVCQACGNAVDWARGQRAHRIPQDKPMTRKYGAKVIHHPLNMALACSLTCNSALSISNHPMEERALVERIRKQLLLDSAVEAKRAAQKAWGRGLRRG